ncbi:hypothetical protein SKAU_G00009010 [Synaphobranchus kaupii]|uniref:PABC domain-containing protein n=1 Tax=Synaphobranchus kaupii TaxID=118154 RepID=A0A9Q1GAJ7_SYNKA|nr:hypothetical protein SKAU_G00009010 [Synaphobranchus kaupii]
MDFSAGHRLYPLIQDLQPDLAPKITDMLLELDNSEPAVPIPDQEPMTFSYLASLSPKDRDQILGWHLYSPILGQQPDLAPKITGMLLQLEDRTILKLLESPESLHAKVKKVVSVLHDVWAQETAKKNQGNEGELLQIGTDCTEHYLNSKTIPQEILRPPLTQTAQG